MEKHLVLQDLIDIAEENGDGFPVFYSCDGGDTFEDLEAVGVEEDAVVLGSKIIFGRRLCLGDILDATEDCDPMIPIGTYRAERGGIGVHVRSASFMLLSQALLEDDDIIVIW